MIEDLTMLANLPVLEKDAAAKAQAEMDKAAAAETMPPPKRTRRRPQRDSEAARLARRGQDPPKQEKAGTKNRR